jgi:two-component system chemotaxis response regulator CheY
MNHRVVIIDDSSLLVKKLADFFTYKLNCEVVATGNDGDEAIALYRKHRPDLLTMDITMPNKDGCTATSEILEEFPDANILVISAVHGEIMLDCLTAGAKGYIEKPLRLTDAEYEADFRRTVKGVLGDRG